MTRLEVRVVESFEKRKENKKTGRKSKTKVATKEMFLVQTDRDAAFTEKLCFLNLTLNSETGRSFL